MGSNRETMLEMVRYVEQGCVDMATLSMRLIHRGTVRPYGSSPGTPVDTGQHRGAGRTALNSPPTFVPPDNAPSYPAWTDSDVDRSLAGAKLGDVMYWRNNGPVPALLEKGHSPQAPSGFLNHSVAQAKIDIEGARYEDDS